MLFFVQIVQIARGQTTLENMMGQRYMNGPQETFASGIVAGTTSLGDAELTSQGIGPQAPGSNAVDAIKPPETCWGQYKKLFGIDTFFATAFHGSKAAEVQARQAANPFNRGCLSNLKDFFCDSAPTFGRRINGEAMLGGEKVDYTTMYQVPPRRAMRNPLQGEGGRQYSSIPADDNV